jgi:integrase
MRGLSVNTIRVRRDHVSYVARATGVPDPAAMSGPALLKLYTCHPQWSTDHRKALRDSVMAFFDHQRPGHDLATHVPPIKPSPGNPRPATDAIWAQILATASPRDLLMARLAAQAGLRRAEVALVHSDDVVPDADGHFCLIVHGKGGKQRVIALTDDLAAQLRSMPAGYVFPGRVGGHLSVGHVGELISALMPAGWSMHTLRHRFASRAYRGTRNLRAVQTALGHESVATTQRYTAVSAAEVRLVSEAAAAALPEDAA